MDKDMVMEKIERHKVLAETFLKNDVRVAITDIDNSYYFADILFVGDEKLTIQCFAPEKKAGNKYYLFWETIIKLEEYHERGGE